MSIARNTANIILYLGESDTGYYGTIKLKPSFELNISDLKFVAEI